MGYTLWYRQDKTSRVHIIWENLYIYNIDKTEQGRVYGVYFLISTKRTKFVCIWLYGIYLMIATKQNKVVYTLYGICFIISTKQSKVLCIFHGMSFIISTKQNKVVGIFQGIYSTIRVCGWFINAGCWDWKWDFSDPGQDKCYQSTLRPR